MAVTVRIPTVFRKFTDNQATIEVDGGSISDVIDQLDGKHPGLKEQLMTDSGELHRFVNVYVNDEDARYLDKLDTSVSDGDTVSILPSVAGGSGGLAERSGASPRNESGSGGLAERSGASPRNESG